MICNICLQDKNDSEFFFRKDTGKFRPKCRACRKVHYNANKDKINSRKRKYRNDHKDEINAQKRAKYDYTAKKRWSLKYSFGITLSEYNRMFNEQNGQCAICEIHQSNLEKALAVDHDHVTGKIRGLLCSKCNLLLGQFKDRADILWKSALYINQYAGGVPPGQSQQEIVENMSNAAPGLDGEIG